MKYFVLNALDLANEILLGHLSEDEVLKDAVARAQRLNECFNFMACFVDSDDSDASAGDDASQPFKGVPFLLKDAFATLKGFPTTNGSRMFNDAAAAADSVLVQRFKNSGLRIFGKTTCPELNSLGTTESDFFGATRNPWNTSYSVGGSSGGSAAAVAARVVPAAHASDGAGSIRIPASCCGVVGLKPSRGRITLAPVLGESVNGGMSEGVVSLSVRDSAALLDVMQGPAPGDPYFAPPPTRPFLEDCNKPPGRLRIALTRQSLINTVVAPECIAACDDVAELCRSLGHEVVEAAPPLDGERYNQAFRRVWAIAVGRSIHRVVAERGRDALGRFSLFNRHLYDISSGIGALDHVLNLEWLQGVARSFAGWMDEQAFDVWLTPTLGLPPTPLGYFDAREHGASVVFDRLMRQVAFTTFANVTGQPAISLPLHWTPGGLPIGLQFAARYGSESLLLSLAAYLEGARPWANHLPPLLEQESVVRSMRIPVEKSVL